jgi:hypothetical protein
MSKNINCPACALEKAGLKSHKPHLAACPRNYNERSYSEQRKLNQQELAVLEAQFSKETDSDKQLVILGQINALRIKIKALGDRITGTSRTALDTYSMPAPGSQRVPYL